MPDLKFVQMRPSSPSLNELESLFKSEWSDFSFCHYHLELPAPIVALHGEKVIGGLSFTFYRHPNSNGDVVWINALFILPEYRGRRIADKLIESATLEVARRGYKQLFAYTHIPSIYQRLGWTSLNSKAQSKYKIMSLELNSHLID
ncbi:GNAT family N-acetyltransferase [Vibrio sp. vnigr-6D03]|uniref:GNAT family N-acetyltransferase n=1 Tax=Vibrio sp. vnigr-6D03 TaxID=2058088 RepID=UPI0015E0D147|nr:GNAT family N-acetyltransferase [Vibrio sp. vnigr-6D03]